MDPQTIFNIVAGAILSVGGWFARQVWDAVKKLQQDLHDLEVDMPKTYVAKQDFSEAMKEIKQGLDKIYDKLDGKADK
jgi:predicted negative regulator of RcsB-dependent stress response